MLIVPANQIKIVQNVDSRDRVYRLIKELNVARSPELLNHQPQLTQCVTASGLLRE